MLMNTIDIKGRHAKTNNSNNPEIDTVEQLTKDIIFKMEIEDRMDNIPETNIFSLTWIPDIFNYQLPTERITWTPDAFKYLSDIIETISNTYLEPYIVNIIKYYIHTQDFDDEYRTWTMTLTTGKQISLLHAISEKVRKILILAFTQYLYLTNLFGSRKLVVDKELTYFSISRIIYTGVIENLSLDIWSLSFAELHAVNLLTQRLFGQKYNTKTDHYFSEIVKMCYFCVWKLMLTVKGQSLYSLRNLIMKAQDLDLSLLTGEEIREFKELFHTNRTIYVRILLVICQEVLRRDEDFDTFNLDYICQARDPEGFKTMLNSFLLEIQLLLSSYNIGRKYTYEL